MEKMLKITGTFKEKYAFSVEGVGFNHPGVKSCMDMSRSQDGLLVSDLNAGKIHLVDEDLALKMSFNTHGKQVGAVEWGESIFFANPWGKSVYRLSRGTGECSALVEGAALNSPTLLAVDLDGGLYISDQNIIWKFKEGQIRVFGEIPGLYTRSLVICENGLCIYNGNNHTLYKLDFAGNLVEQLEFSAIFPFQDKFAGFQVDPGEGAYYISVGKRLYKYDRKGDLIFEVNLVNHFKDIGNINKLFLVSSGKEKVLFLIDTMNVKQVYRCRFR